MKKWITGILFLFLIGCEFVPQVYDPNEYLILVQIETNSKLIQSECDNPTGIEFRNRITKLYEDSELFKTYTHYIPHNAVVAKQATVIADNIRELHDKDNFTEEYCKIKTKLIVVAAQRTLVTIGQKPRSE